MQYWKPAATEEFAGDMMPFWDGQRFHLFYLLDRHHHAERGGLGGHQWAHASTVDLVQWEHHPLALPIGAAGTADENGICTGSLFEHQGAYHAFYAARLKHPDGSVFEAVCRAVSRDLIRFEKSPNNPLFPAPPGLDPKNHRDPFVFRHPETGVFHMLVTASASRLSGENPEDGLEHGVLAHYSSADLERWEFQGPFLTIDKDPCPECPEHFLWNEWWYLVYSQGAEMQYWISDTPLGPWRRARRDTIEGPNLAVPRTASWTGGRRIAVGFLPWRRDNRDGGDYVYAGSAVFRELLQEADGTLATRFVPEMMPQPGTPIAWRLQVPSSQTVREVQGGLLFTAAAEVRVAHIPEIPADCTLTFRVTPEPGTDEYGLLLRADERLGTGYRLRFRPKDRCVTLQRSPTGEGRTRAAVYGLESADRAIDVVVCMRGSIIDVCLDGRHTLVERCFDYAGSHLAFQVRAGGIRVEDLRIAPLL